jgi:microcin C transport system substrate-binding protein
VDALIERVVAAKNRNDLTTAARALDRVLRAGHYWVSHWYKPSNTIAYWDKFSRPKVKPRYDRGILDTWWYDKAKAAKVAAGAASPGAAKGEGAAGGSSRLGLMLGGILVLAMAGYMVMRSRRKA